MDTTRIEAIGHQVKGALKQSLGRIIGDAKLQADGTAERTAAEANRSEIEQVAGIDTDRIMGIGRQFAGAVKQGIAGLTGNAKLADKGSAERASGKAQNQAGSVRDQARDAAKAGHPDVEGR